MCYAQVDRPGECRELGRPISGIMVITIDSLQRLYTFIFALAITESLKEFSHIRGATSADATSNGAKRSWPFIPSCLPALISIVVLIVLFFHGMNLYLQRTYAQPAVHPHGGLLLIDIAVFMVEAVIMFLLSRHLSVSHWREFYFWILVLLAIDAGWGIGVHAIHGARTLNWVNVNVVAVLILMLLRFAFKKNEQGGALLCCLVMLARTACDYWLSWDFYFG